MASQGSLSTDANDQPGEAEYTEDIYSYGGYYDYAAYEAYTEQVIEDKVIVYVYPVLLVFGIFSNILVIFTLVKSDWRRLPLAFFLIFVAISDIVMLLERTLNQWVKHLFYIGYTEWVLTYSELTCKTYSFINSCVYHLSSWFLVVPVTEVALITHKPEKCHHLLLETRTIHLWLVLILSAVMINGHFFFTYELVDQSEWNAQFGILCTFKPSDGRLSEMFRTYLWPTLDRLVPLFIPNILILISALYIMRYKLCKRSEYIRVLNSNRFIRYPDNFGHFRVLVVVLGLSFCLTSIPEMVYNLYESIHALLNLDSHMDNEMYMQSIARRQLSSTLVCGLRDAFMALKIVIYLLYWPHFKNTFISMFRCSRCCSHHTKVNRWSPPMYRCPPPVQFDIAEI